MLQVAEDRAWASVSSAWGTRFGTDAERADSKNGATPIWTMTIA